jgi:hypothetical protein
VGKPIERLRRNEGRQSQNIFSLKEKKQVYEISMLCVCVALSALETAD